MAYLTSESSGLSILSLLFLFLFWVDHAFAQTHITPELISNSQSTSVQTAPPVTGELKMIGVMIEFLPDDNRFTSGNGTFGPGSIPYLENPGTNIDALPHNQNYFEAHFEFAKNYFETVSGDKIAIDFEVFPKVFRLNHEMADYSPTGENPDLSAMADFVADVWTLIDESGQFSTRFTETDSIAFVIFHAGVGRDIELTGTNLDKTPQDLPSFYLSRKTLSEFLDDPSFSGFPVNRENLLVDHSLVIPRTLTRAGTDAAGNRFVLPLSINGLLTAQIGSYLGLPDLFNTQNGQAGIGRFGLMDGAGIFSYNGLFPPEPSAWEKTFLDWSSPFLIEHDTEYPISLTASAFHQDESIAEIPISSDEYFLIENRHRDPDGNGVRITIKKSDGTYTEQTFSNEDVAFINQDPGFDELLEPGVVVNVSNFDFSLPGGMISETEAGNDEILNGGILIWHVEEGVIQSNIAQGGVNDNPDRRGVDLEEADGAQDIGRPTSIGLFQNDVNGSAFDFWWAENDAKVVMQTDTLRLYDNRFGPDTTPGNHSNSGAPSYFELYDFSDNQLVASFKIRPIQPFTDVYELWDSRSDLEIKTFADSENEYWRRFPLAAQPIITAGDEWMLLPGYDGVQFYHPESKTMTKPLIFIESHQQPFIKNNLFTVAENPGEAAEQLSVTIYQFDGENLSEKTTFSVPSNHAFISSFEENILDIDGTTERIDLNSNEIIRINHPAQVSEKIGEYQSKVENGSLILHYPGGTESFLINQQDRDGRAYTGLIQISGNRIFFYLFEDGQFSVFSPDDNYQSQKIIHTSDFLDWPAFADFNRDGNPDFLFVDYTSNQLMAKNQNGAFLSSFPIPAPEEVHFVGTPLVADLNGDEKNEVIITGYDHYSMNLYAFDEKANLMNGFPLYVGGVKEKNSQPVHPLISGNKLFAVSHTGDLKVWEFKEVNNVQWRSKYGNQTSNKISGFIEIEGSANPPLSLLNNEETYNWPNPAKDETQLRFQTREPAEIHIQILTMSGRIVGNHTLQSKGGVSEELLIDTSSWASGGYIALVEASSNGITETKVVKIAIAR